MEFWNYTLEIGDLSLSPRSILLGLILITALFMLVSLLKRILRERVFPRVGLAQGVSIAISTLISYVLLILGFLVIVPVMVPGFNVNTLAVVLGSLSFGVGFGLRNVADNFFSGIILLIERPIKVSDRIQVDGVHGSVVEIRARSTTVRTNDNIDIIVPNTSFITGNVVNLSHNDTRVRFRIPIGVHYESDLEAVENALMEAADAVPDVLKHPEPGVRLVGFGDSSVDYELRVWTDSLYHLPGRLISEVNREIWKAFKRHGISIPYPQRDVHVIDYRKEPAEAKSSTE
jgi:small-conductance mechanosensitive channel